MSLQDVHVSDQPGRIEPAAFHTQLRRLESLQALMTQGGAVVSEVAQFLARAREELDAFQQEQESCAESQRRIVEEKAQLLLRVADLEKTERESGVRSREREGIIEALQAQLAARSVEQSGELKEVEASRASLEGELKAAVCKVARLEAALQAEREARERAIAGARQEELSLQGSEIDLLKNRLAVVEHQLQAERERRTRLMEVVKTHEVVVNASSPLRQREVAR